MNDKWIHVDCMEPESDKKCIVYSVTQGVTDAIFRKSGYSKGWFKKPFGSYDNSEVDNVVYWQPYPGTPDGAIVSYLRNIIEKELPIMAEAGGVRSYGSNLIVYWFDGVGVSFRVGDYNLGDIKEVAASNGKELTEISYYMDVDGCRNHAEIGFHFKDMAG